MNAHYIPILGSTGIVVDHQLSGGTLEGKWQSIYEESAIQNFPIGTRFQLDDRVFRYCKATTALRALNGAKNANYPREGSTAAVVYVAGTDQVTLAMNDHGTDYVAEQVADYWKDGYIWIMYPSDTTQYGQIYRIKSSSVAFGTIPAKYVTLTLYEALKATIAASSWHTAWANPYSNVKKSDSARMSVICVPLIPVTSGYYFWGQTWGPIFMSCSHAAPGLTDNDREIYFHESREGEIVPGSQVVFTAGQPFNQRAGFLLTNTTPWTNVGDASEPGGDSFIMLQLAP